QEGQPISLVDWGTELIERITPYAKLLDQALDSGDSYTQAALAQQAKLTDSTLTPSAILLADMRTQGLGLHEYTLRQSLRHRETLRSKPLSPASLNEYEQIARDSFTEQKHLEDSDTEDFDRYVARFHAALKPL